MGLTLHAIRKDMRRLTVENRERAAKMAFRAELLDLGVQSEMDARPERVERWLAIAYWRDALGTNDSDRFWDWLHDLDTHVTVGGRRFRRYDWNEWRASQGYETPDEDVATVVLADVDRARAERNERREGRFAQLALEDYAEGAWIPPRM